VILRESPRDVAGRDVLAAEFLLPAEGALIQVNPSPRVAAV